MRTERRNETWQYLLGNLSEEQQVQIEDRAFADSDYLSALEATEADLIDAYVRGELSRSDRRSFELRFLTSAERRRKLEFARALATITSEARTPQPRVVGRSFFMGLRGWKPAALAAGMAALICIAGSSWLMYQNAAMRSRVAALEVERRGLQTTEEALRQQLRGEQARAAAPASPTRSPSETGSEPFVASLVLVPGLSRAQTRAERLQLGPAVQIARIEIQLEPRDQYPRYRAELRTRGGDEVLSRGNLVRRKSGPGFAISFEVPASALAPGDYELAVQGIAADHTSEDIGYYYFAVQKR